MKIVNKLIVVLMFAGASISLHAMKNPSEYESLENAAKNGDYGEVKNLLNKGVNPLNTHALFLAAYNGHRNIARLLIKHGADIAQLNHTAIHNVTPLKIAVGDDDMQMVKFLIENGADVDILTDAGYTPLMYAAFDGQELIVWTILTTIPLNERKKLLTQLEETNARITAAELSMKQSGAVAQKDIRKMISKLIFKQEVDIDRIIDEQMQRIRQMLAVKSLQGETIQLLSGHRPLIAKMIDLDNPDTYQKIRDEVRKNVIKIMFSKPVVPVKAQEQTVEEEDPFDGF